MDWELELNQDKTTFNIKAAGTFVTDDCIAIKLGFLAHPEWRPGINLFYDYRDTDFSTITLEALRGIVAFHESNSELIGDGRMAFLMGTPRDFGFARQYEMVSEGRVQSRVRVFLDEEKARNWIETGQEPRSNDEV